MKAEHKPAFTRMRRGRRPRRQKRPGMTIVSPIGKYGYVC